MTVLTMAPVDIFALIPATDNAGTAIADQRLTIDGTAGGVMFTPYNTAQVTHVLVSFETAQCRFTMDGSAPNATNGHISEPGDERIFTVETFNALKLIRTGGTSAVAHASPMVRRGGV